MQTTDILTNPPFRRVLLKFSGEAIAGPESKFGINYTVLRAMCQEVVDAIREFAEREKEKPEGKRSVLQVAIVVGGGNFLRGKDAKANGIKSTASDKMGMCATLINSLATQDVFEQIQWEGSTRVMSALEISEVAELFIERRAVRHLNRGHIIILAAGSGKPFFTTDTAAVLRAKEISAHIILKATDAPGICARDPRKFPDEKPFARLTFEECIAKRYEVMDQTAFTLAQQDSPIPIRVFSMMQRGNICRALLGENIGTLVTAQEEVPLAAE